MNTTQKKIKTCISTLFMFSLALTFVLFQSCKKDKKASEQEIAEVKKENVIDIVTRHMDFEMPDTIPSGWITFRYKNMSPQTHFFLIDNYPDGKTSEDAKKYVAPVFDSGMKLINEGKAEEGFAEFANLPEWFSDVIFVGGSGLLSPGQTAETTINMKPGNYILECYIKMSNGIFHSSMGMTKDIVVSDEESGNAEPEADIDIELSSTNGIVFNDSIKAGTHIFSVQFKDQIVHENFVGHDINVVKLDEGADLKVLESWMNWADPKGLIEPAPDLFTFLGGINDMPANNTGYFKETLSPGKYVLISEVPNSMEKNMLKTFEVTE